MKNYKLQYVAWRTVVVSLRSESSTSVTIHPLACTSSWRKPLSMALCWITSLTKASPSERFVFLKLVWLIWQENILINSIRFQYWFVNRLTLIYFAASAKSSNSRRRVWSCKASHLLYIWEVRSWICLPVHGGW